MTKKYYKGFNPDMTCRDFQYEEGKEYETDEAIECCKNGFHACEDPLDCFNYYAPGQSVYHEVEQSGEISRRNDGDSKIASSKIKIGAKIDIAKIVSLHFDFVKSRTTFENTDPKQASAGENGAASAGENGAASAGWKGAASAGSNGAASAGWKGAASAGENGAASAGENGAASAGSNGAASAGWKGAASAGENGAASAGAYGAASAGENGAAVSKGSAAVGMNGIACVRGNNCKVKGGLGAILAIAEENNHDNDIKEWKVFVVDGEKVKADTYYALKDGEIVEAENQDNEKEN